MGSLHTMVRPDGRTLSMAARDTILLAGRSQAGMAQWDAGVAPVVDTLLIIFDAVLLGDGSVAACGTLDNRSGLYLRMDTLGHVLSARSYQHNNSTWLSTLTTMANGDLRLCGSTSVAFASVHGYSLEVDPQGDLIDARRWEIGGVDQRPREMIATSDGGQAVIGEAWQMSGGSPTWKLASIAKLDSTGHVQWAWRVSQPGRKTFPEAIVELADGRLLYWIRAEYAGAGSKPVLIEFAADGTPGDMVQLDAASPSDGWLSSGGGSLSTMAVQGDTAMVMAGFGNVTDSLFFLRVDTALTNASLLFQARLPGEWPEELVALPDGAFLRTAYASSPLGGHGIALSYLNNVGESACGDQIVPVAISTPPIIFSSIFSQDTANTVVSDVSALFAPAAVSYMDLIQCLPSSHHENPSSYQLPVFPNPAADRLTVAYAGPGDLRLFDATGRCCLARTILRGGAVEVDVAHLASGRYQLLLIAANTVQRMAVVIQH
jgi:hypothetical protein